VGDWKWLLPYHACDPIPSALKILSFTYLIELKLGWSWTLVIFNFDGVSGSDSEGSNSKIPE
jgi:hypothetical protein